MNPIAFLDDIKTNKILIEEAQNKQKKICSNIKKVLILANINKLLNGRNNTIKFVDDMVQWFLKLKEKQ